MKKYLKSALYALLIPALTVFPAGCLAEPARPAAISATEIAAALEEPSSAELETAPTEVAAPAAEAAPPETEPSTEAAPAGSIMTLSITAVGDCTLGNSTFRDSDPSSFTGVFNKHAGDEEYFMENVKPIFDASDFTIANLEVVLTTASQEADRPFRFRGAPGYADILKEAGVDAVNFANNHCMDFLQIGYDDTKAALREEGVLCSEDGQYALTEVKGLKLALVSFCYNFNYIKAIKEARTKVDLVIFVMHAGVEYDYLPSSAQKSAAHSAIDAGADLVIGSHPHVIQGVELYKGRYIAYSLGNFCYGGNTYPRDYDSMILRANFTFEGGALVPKDDAVELIPCSISSASGINDYQPTPYEGARLGQFIEKFNGISAVKLDAADGSVIR